MQIIPVVSLYWLQNLNEIHNLIKQINSTNSNYAILYNNYNTYE